MKKKNLKVRFKMSASRPSCVHLRGHQTSPTVVSLKGRLPQKLQSKFTLSCEIIQIHSVLSWFYKETEIKI